MAESNPDGGATSPRAKVRDAQATREALLSAAHQRFTRLGFQGTTLRDVAADAGVNIALVKRYFGSKEGLFKAALALQPQGLAAGAAAPADREALVREMARQLSPDAWSAYQEHPVLLLVRESGDPGTDELRRAALTDISRSIASAAGDGAGSVEQDLLPAQVLLATGVGMAVLRAAVGLQPLVSAGSDQIEPMVRRLVDALFPSD
ncbi:TetR/AcrR family transcriptional regulator [Catenulispora rubra]|uniref:TetR/AcrR family transcriptional regulator n=1 Tax=Catenulispora rubra TaxID=280293 RepID=UPI001892040A|nr:TetR/AcrR family transcriptional regulator [Catenulispora rubra]